MSSSKKTSTANPAEVASEVVRVAHKHGISLETATMIVMVERGYDFGNSMEILKMAQKAVDSNPEIAEGIEQNKKQCSTPTTNGYVGHVAHSARALAEIEDRAPVIFPFSS